MWMKYSESCREMFGQPNLPDGSGDILGEWHCLKVADGRAEQVDAQALWFFLVGFCVLGFLLLFCFVLFWFFVVKE